MGKENIVMQLKLSLQNLEQENYKLRKQNIELKAKILNSIEFFEKLIKETYKETDRKSVV